MDRVQPNTRSPTCLIQRNNMPSDAVTSTVPEFAIEGAAEVCGHPIVEEEASSNTISHEANTWPSSQLLQLRDVPACVSRCHSLRPSTHSAFWVVGLCGVTNHFDRGFVRFMGEMVWSQNFSKDRDLRGPENCGVVTGLDSYSSISSYHVMVSLFRRALFNRASPYARLGNPTGGRYGNVRRSPHLFVGEGAMIVQSQSSNV